MPDRECPCCGQAAAAVVDVHALGTAELTERAGVVHAEPRFGWFGRGWRLYCHAEADST